MAVKHSKDADVNTPSIQFVDMQLHWQLPRTLMGGTIAMRTAGKVYLPKEPKETERNYQNRLLRTVCYPGFSQTIAGLSARPFRRAAVVGEGMDLRLIEMANNVDLAGRNLTKFAMDIFADALTDGICYILVDYPNLGEQKLSAQGERAAGIRPYFVSIPAVDLIEAQISRDNSGKENLTRVRIRQQTIESDGTPFGMIARNRVKVWYPDHWELWWQGPKGDDDWVLETQGVNTLNYIPIVPVYCGWAGYFVGYPPLEELAFLNMKHWQSQSDQDNILHIARVPLLMASGMQADLAGTTLEVGPNTIITASDANARMVYVEHSGKAIGAGRDSLKDLEAQMAMMGFSPLVSQSAPGDLTATGRAIDAAESDTKLQAWTRSLENSLQAAYKIAADWLGIKLDDEPDITLNTEFGLSLNDIPDLTILFQARQIGDLGPEAFLTELKRRGVLSETFDVEQALIEIQQRAQNLAVLTPKQRGNNPAGAGAQPGSRPSGTGDNVQATSNEPPFGSNPTGVGTGVGGPQPAQGA